MPGSGVMSNAYPAANDHDWSVITRFKDSEIWSRLGVSGFRDRKATEGLRGF